MITLNFALISFTIGNVITSGTVICFQQNPTKFFQESSANLAAINTGTILPILFTWHMPLFMCYQVPFLCYYYVLADPSKQYLLSKILNLSIHICYRNFTSKQQTCPMFINENSVTPSFTIITVFKKNNNNVTAPTWRNSGATCKSPWARIWDKVCDFHAIYYLTLCLFSNSIYVR